MRETLFFEGIFLVTLAVGVSSFGQASSTKIVPMNDWIKIEPADAGISDRKVQHLFDLSFSEINFFSSIFLFLSLIHI